MLLKQSTHFQTRLLERGISFQDVKDAVRYPDSTEEVFGGKIKATKKVGEKTIEVIYYKDRFKSKENMYILVTAYYL